jgi:hypothetical protein
MFCTNVTYSEVLATAPLRRPSTPLSVVIRTSFFEDKAVVKLRGKLQLIPKLECVEFFLHSSMHLHGVKMLLSRVLWIIMYYRFLCNDDNYYNYFLCIFRWNCLVDSNNINLRVWLRHNNVHKVGCWFVFSPQSLVTTIVVLDCIPYFTVY